MNEMSRANQARPPQQARGRERFERILETAEKQLLERGIDEFSIPELAATLGYTRTSVYHFFPTAYAILNELTSRHLQCIEDEVEALSQTIGSKDWRQVLEDVSVLVANYYNQHPVAGILMLGSISSHESHRAMQLTILHIGRHVEQLMASIGVELPSGELDPKALTVELGTACLRLSYFLHGKITPAYQRECAAAMIGYLSRFIDN